MVDKEESDLKKYYRLVAEQRGTIISFFAIGELIMSKFISLHYFKRIRNDFVTEVLEDEYFSYSLRCKVFKKILKEYYSELYSKFPKNEFRRMKEIRDMLAHSLLETVMITDRMTGKSYYIKKCIYKYENKEIDANDTWKEFEELKIPIENFWSQLPGEASAVLKDVDEQIENL